MSSVERRTNRDGSESWRVKFLHDKRRMTRTFEDEVSAARWRSTLDLLGVEKALDVLSKPAPVGEQRTVAAQVRHHIEHLTGVEDGTRRKYESIARRRFTGEYERIMLADFTRDHVSRWVNTQTGSPKTIKNAHSLLSAALASAVRDHLIAANVAKGVTLPRLDSGDDEDVYLTKDEVWLLLSLVGEHWRPFIAFLAQTGCRFSEASALDVGSVDVEHGQARIHRAWKYTAGHPPKLGPPKTRRSRRTIYYPPAIGAMLATVMAGKRSDEFVFTNTRGAPVRNGVFHEGVWQPVMPEFERLTGKRPRVHDTRHAYASWAISAGVPLTVIQRQLGHESITTTSDRYGHLIRSDMDALINAVAVGMPAIPTGPRVVRQIEG